MTTDKNQTTETWYITFGLDTRHGKQYTEVVVDTVEQVEGYDMATGRDCVVGEPLDLDVRHERVHAAAVESYGTARAFEYSPEKFASSIERYGLTLRERIGARRPDGSLVPVISAVNEAVLHGMTFGEEIQRDRGVQ
jgi:hypothetical protein